MRLLLTHVIFWLSGCACFAGNVESVIPESSFEFEINGNETIWRGFYAGGIASLNYGEQTDGVGDQPSDTDGSMLGLFAGYNFQSGGLVYGAEAAYALGDISSAPSEIGVEYSSLFDVKARAGYSVGKALLYGVVGGSLGVADTVTGPSETISTAGMNYGLGVDYQVTERVFVGAEYLVRDLVGELESAADVNIETLFQSAQIRVGLRF